MLSPKYTLNAGGHAPTYIERKPTGWSRFYHSDYLLAFPMGVKLYTFFSNAKLVIPWLGGSVSTGIIGRSVEWNREKTVMESAKLSIQAITDWVPADYIVYFNGENVYRKDFPPFSPPQDTALVDVTSLLANGVNEVSVTFERPVPLGGATLTFTVTLTVTYGGEPPSPPPPWEDLVNWVKNHPVETAVVAGGGMVAMGAVIYLRKKR